LRGAFGVCCSRLVLLLVLVGQEMAFSWAKQMSANTGRICQVSKAVIYWNVPPRASWLSSISHKAHRIPLLQQVLMSLFEDFS